MAIDFEPVQGLFSVLCFRTEQSGALELVTAVLNRYRLRELEAILVELQITLPEWLRGYFVAVLGEDESGVAKFGSAARRLLCCQTRDHALSQPACPTAAPAHQTA